MIWDSIVEFNDLYFPGWRETPPLFLSNALAGEVGEVCNDVKHLVGGGTNRRTPSKAELLKELADVQIYLVLFAEVLGKDEDGFSDVVLKKIGENRERMTRGRSP